MSKYQIISFADAPALAEDVATRWLDLLARRSSTSPFCIALSGGRIARDFYSALARLSVERAIPLDAVHFFWGDERCVPPSHPECSYAAANELLFRPLRIAEDQVHRIRGEDPEEQAVARAEAELCRIAPLNDDGVPVFDLMLLGMGEDGHVASLFPEEPVAMFQDRATYRGVTATKPPPQRITVGYGVIAAANQVWVLASGKGKEEALAASLAPEGDTPLARVLQSRKNTLILSNLVPDKR